MKAMTKNGFAEELRRAGATVQYQPVEDSFQATRDGRSVEVFYNGDRFHDAWALGTDGEPLRKTLRTMAAVRRYLANAEESLEASQ